MVRVFFLIRSLHIGGAERQLVNLVKGLDKSCFDVAVGLFYNEGPLREELLADRGVRIYPLGKRGRWDIFRFTAKLIQVLREFRPDILYSYLPDANVFGLLAKYLAGIPHVVWGVRASNMDFTKYDGIAGFIFRIAALQSSHVDLIIANSAAGAAFHCSQGYDSRRFIVVPNGLETDHFYPDPVSGKELRSEWEVLDSEILIGLVGRYDPMKDHPTFLRAAALLLHRQQNARFVCIGGGCQQYQAELQSLARELGLDRYIVWAGARRDMQHVYNALNIGCSSSYGEGFPNVVAEAMACGVPCVVTDVGDSRLVVGDTGIVVPPKDPEMLCEALQKMILLGERGRHEFGMKARQRIIQNFGVERLITTTGSILNKLVSSALDKRVGER